MVQHASGERHANRRGLCDGDRGCARPVVRHRQRDGAEVIAAGERFRPRAQHDLRRAEVVADDAEVVRLDLRQRRFAREQLDAGLLGGEARRQARRAARALARVRQFLRREEARQILGRVLGEQPLDAGDLDRIDAAALRGRGHPTLGPARPVGPRINNAALVPANPRHSTSAMGARGTWCDADTARPSQSGSSSRSAAMPGTTFARSAARPTTVSRCRRRR